MTAYLLLKLTVLRIRGYKIYGGTQSFRSKIYERVLLTGQVHCIVKIVKSVDNE